MKPVPSLTAEEALEEEGKAVPAGTLIEAAAVSVAGDKTAFDNLIRNFIAFLRTFYASPSGKSK